MTSHPIPLFACLTVFSRGCGSGTPVSVSTTASTAVAKWTGAGYEVDQYRWRR
jgi:hypothetical protein